MTCTHLKAIMTESGSTGTRGGGSMIFIKELDGGPPVWTDPPQDAWAEVACVGPGVFRNWHWMEVIL